MRKYFLIGLVALDSCKQHKPYTVTLSDKLLDTLAKLRIKEDFRPLDSAEAYNFMNTVYLPMADSMGWGRHIYINPLTNINYKKSFSGDSARLVNPALRNKIVLTPPGIILDTLYQWNGDGLQGVEIITSLMVAGARNLNYGAWVKKFGRKGYLYISYPVYNEHTHHLIMRQWWENGDKCGTGKERFFAFGKTANSWKVIE